MRAAALLLLGVLMGVVGALLQAQQTHVAGHLVPTGALMVAAALVPIARSCAWWVGSRWGAVAFSLGWLVATLVMATRTPGGDLALSGGTRQIAYLGGCSMLLAAACGYPLLVAGRREVAGAMPDDA